MDAGINQERIGGVQKALEGAASMRGLRHGSYQENAGNIRAAAGVGAEFLGSESGTGSGTGQGTGGGFWKKLGAGGQMGLTYAGSELKHDQYGMQARAEMYGADGRWDGMASGQRAKGFQAHA